MSGDSSSLSRNPQGGIVQSSSLCPIIMSINVHYHVQSSSSCPIIMSINVHHHIQSSSLSRNPQGGIVQSSSSCPILMSINVHHHVQSLFLSRNPHGGLVQCPMAVSHNFKFAHFRRCPLHLFKIYSRTEQHF